MVGDCLGQFSIGELSPGTGFRPFRTKGDDGGRHRRRRKVNRVFMSWRFDRPDFLDLESRSECRASGLDGRYFPPPEVTPLIVVLQRRRHDRWAPFLKANTERGRSRIHRIRKIESVLCVRRRSDGEDLCSAHAAQSLSYSWRSPLRTRIEEAGNHSWMPSRVAGASRVTLANA